MSLGDSSLNDGKDPMAQALNALSSETGALFVVAAGNSYAEGSLGSPAPRTPPSRSARWTTATCAPTSPATARAWATTRSSPT